jgi:hypothetical protein
MRMPQYNNYGGYSNEILNFRKGQKSSWIAEQLPVYHEALWTTDFVG